jgi:hypothetical protein
MKYTFRIQAVTAALALCLILPLAQASVPFLGSSAAFAKKGADDKPGHDVGDDKGGRRGGKSADDKPGHDAGDDKGGRRGGRK